MRIQLLYSLFLFSFFISVHASQVGVKTEKKTLHSLDQFYAAMQHIHQQKTDKTVTFDSPKPSDSSNNPAAKDKK